MKHIALALLAFLFFPTASIAENYFLILTKKGTGLERIKMTNLNDCKDLGEQWSSVSRKHTYVCLKDNKSD